MDDVNDTAGTEGAPEDTGAAPADGDDTSADPLPATAKEAEAEEDAAWADALGEKPEGDAEDDPSESADEAGEEGAEQEAAETGDAGDVVADAEVDWGALPPEVKAAHDATMARAAKAEHDAKSAQGREKAAQRRLDDMMAGEGKTADDPDGQPKAEGNEVDTKAAKEEWQTFVSDYPEIAKPVERMFGSLYRQINGLTEENKQLKTGMTTIGQERRETRILAEEAAVLDEHPDLRDIANTDEFIAWVDEQPEFIQEGARANAEDIVDAPTVNRLLKMYKEDKGIANGGRNGTANAGRKTGSRKPADPIRNLRRRNNSGGPRPSPGAAVPETAAHENPEAEEAKAWDAMERQDEERMKRSAARA